MAIVGQFAWASRSTSGVPLGGWLGVQGFALSPKPARGRWAALLGPCPEEKSSRAIHIVTLLSTLEITHVIFSSSDLTTLGYPSRSRIRARGATPMGPHPGVGAADRIVPMYVIAGVSRSAAGEGGRIEARDVAQGNSSLIRNQ
jgi:hypothetical protein